MVEFRMPSLGADMEAGTLVEWLVKPGDRVKRGDIVAVVETQKGAIEIEIFQAGQIEEILVDLDSKVPVGTPLALIRTEGEAKPAPQRLAPPPSRRVRSAAAAPLAPAPAGPSTSPRPPPAAVRGVARAACGPRPPRGGLPRRTASISRRDRQRPGRRDHLCRRRAPSRRGRRAAGKRSGGSGLISTRCERPLPPRWRDRSGKSRTTISRIRSMSRLRAMADAQERGAAARQPPADRSARNQGGRPGCAPLPRLQRVLSRRQIRAGEAVHVGVAIAIRGGGLAAPALHDADQLSLDELMSCMRDLVQRTRAGRIRSSEMSDPTITVSSLGERGVEALYGIIYPPQVAIVGFGKVVTRPWVVDGAIGPRSVVTITLSADHRVSDGHAGALFLAEIGKLLQEPDKL